jgi:uncharacterized protein (DUF2062 family)
MVFRRRDRRPVLTYLGELFFPRGGWKRATQYVIHRVRRLPDPPHRIARGVFAGVFISFTPLFGLHLILAWLIALALRGNVLAALLATFFGNPVTTPIIALSSVELGHWILGTTSSVGIAEISDFFAQASVEVWTNIRAVFTPETAEWGHLIGFFRGIFLPYLVGGIGPGLVFATACYYLTIPVVRTYQKIRDRQRRERIERAIDKRQKAMEKERRRAERSLSQLPEDRT